MPMLDRKHLNFIIDVSDGYFSKTDIYDYNTRVAYIIIHEDGTSYFGLVDGVKFDNTLYWNVIATVKHIINNKFLRNTYKQYKLKYLCIPVIGGDCRNNFNHIKDIFDLKSNLNVLPLHNSKKRKYLKYDLIKGEFI